MKTLLRTASLTTEEMVRRKPAPNEFVRKHACDSEAWMEKHAAELQAWCHQENRGF
jgi:hypothetical protein